MSMIKGTGSASNAGSLVGLVFIVFLVLKLTGVIDWSWWWVTRGAGGARLTGGSANGPPWRPRRRPRSWGWRP